MESWRIVWREGFAPQLSIEALATLKVALETDDPDLLQGVTTSPPPLQCVQDQPVEAACVLGFCGVVEHGGFGVARAVSVIDFFAKTCFEADRLLGEPTAVRWFLNWYDETPRDEMRRELLAEVVHEQERRVKKQESN